MDAQVAGYGRFVGVPSRSDLERFFVLDSVDRDLLGDRRGDHNRLGFMVQAATVRYIGVFLKDPVDVPWPVVEFVAEQLLNTIVGAYDRGGLSSLAMPIPGVPCGGSSASPPRRRSGTPRSDGARRPGIVGRSPTAGLVGNFVTARGESWPLATRLSTIGGPLTRAARTGRRCCGTRRRRPSDSSPTGGSWRLRAEDEGVSAEFRRFLDGRAWTHAEGPGALFVAALLIADGCNVGLTPVLDPGRASADHGPAVSRRPELCAGRHPRRGQRRIDPGAGEGADCAGLEWWPVGVGGWTAVRGAGADVERRSVTQVPRLQTGPHLAQCGQRPGHRHRRAGGVRDATGQPAHPGRAAEPDAGPKPDLVATDEAAYSEMVFGVFRMLGTGSPRGSPTSATPGTGGRNGPPTPPPTTAR